MKKYIIFFGKSQAFTFYAFDENGLVKDFNRIIKDFSFLESKYFTTDNVDNSPILSKYNFKDSDGVAYSLLKLYSFAQAYSAGRIDGSIYGVALLSDHDLRICEKNNKFLKSALKQFADYSLNEKKFNKTDFFNDVENIWIAFNNKYGYGHIQVEGNPIVSANNTQIGYYTPDLFADSLRLKNEINNECSRIYFSADFDHLKRANKKWGDKFPVLEEGDNGKYYKYQESKQVSGERIPAEEKCGVNNEAQSNIQSEAKEPNNRERKIFEKLIIERRFLTVVFYVSIIINICLLILHISDINKIKEIQKKEYSVNANDENTGEKVNNIKIGDLLSDDNKLRLLSELLLNIIRYKDQKNDEYEQRKAIVILIRKDSEKLGLDQKEINKLLANDARAAVNNIEKRITATYDTAVDGSSERKNNEN